MTIFGIIRIYVLHNTFTYPARSGAVPSPACWARSSRRRPGQRSRENRKRKENLYCLCSSAPLPLRSSAAFSNIFELVLGHAEVMTELVPERKSDLLANFVIGGANGFDVFLVEQDMIRTRRHIPTTPCRLRDPDKFAHQQDFIRILAEQAARVLLSTRHVLHHYCHILNPPSEFFRQ